MIFRSKNNSWVLNNHFYPTKSYSKWNMAGKTNLSASRSMQFLTGKSHLARRIFFQMSSRKLWLMSLTWWMVISICELPTLLKDFTAAYTVTLYYQLNCALFPWFYIFEQLLTTIQWTYFKIPFKTRTRFIYAFSISLSSTSYTLER